MVNMIHLLRGSLTPFLILETQGKSFSQFFHSFRNDITTRLPSMTPKNARGHDITLPQVDPGTRIPRRILQTYSSQAEADLELCLCRRRTLALHPHSEWTHDFFTDAGISNYFEALGGPLQHVYDSLPLRIQKVDFFRYVNIYLEGGIYMDMDVLLTDNLSFVVEARGSARAAAVFPFESLTRGGWLLEEYSIGFQLGQYFFAAPKGHPFLRDIILNVPHALLNPRVGAEYPYHSIEGRGVGRNDSIDASASNAEASETEATADTAHYERTPWACYYIYATTGPLLVTRTLGERAWGRSISLLDIEGVETTSLGSDAEAAIHVLVPDRRFDIRDNSSWWRVGSVGLHLSVGTWRRRPPTAA